MADQTLTQQVFSRGVVRDSARHAIPEGGVYDALDFLFDRPGEVYKRGGSAFQSEALSGESLIVAVAAPEFPGSPRVVVIASDGSDRTLYDVTDDTAATGLDANGAQPTENPPLYVDRLIVTDGIGDGMGTFYAPQKVYLDGDDVAIDDLGGTPPNARCSCVHLDYLVLANGTDPNDSDSFHPNRVWFNPIGTDTDIEDTWDTADGYIDTAGPVIGLASVAGVLVVFHRGSAERILGDVAPGIEGENMSLQPLGAVGCIDARSIVKMNGLVYFANESGVYSTNGSGYESITSKPDQSGIAVLWAEQMQGFAPALGAVVCAGVHLNEWLFLTIRHTDDGETPGDRFQWLYHEGTGSWTRLSDGVSADMYASRFAPDAELYAACGDPEDPVQLLALSGLFAPVEGNNTDANGEEVEPAIEFRPFAAGTALKAFGFGHLTFDVTAGSGIATVVSVAAGLEASSFETAATLEQVGQQRRRFDAFADSEAMSVRVVQDGASASTRLFAVEMEARLYDADSEIAA